MPEVSTSKHSSEYVWLRRFAKLVCFATFLLIFFGGQVKSHEAGLSVPDWPLTYYQNPITYPISNWQGGIFYEHFHRLVAGVVAVMTLVLAFWLTFRANERWLKVLGWLAVFSVLCQSVLGGLTVLYKLPVIISSSHGILAQTFFVITLIIAYGLSKERRRREEAPGPEYASSILPASLLLVAFVFLQLFAGAVMRHLEAGLAIPDFPTVAGHWLPAFNDQTLEWINDWRMQHVDAMGASLPDVTMGQVLIHFAHRLGALTIGFMVILMTLVALRHRREQPLVLRTMLTLLVMVAIQITLGATVIWTAKQPIITSIHVLVGAGILGFSVLLVLRAWPVGGLEQAEETPEHEQLPAHASGAS